ncbi:hypothetical protein B484DRAFT_323038, partial [Ochromonadaceae sp. CCMP2298]
EKKTAVRGKLLKEAQEYKEKLEKRGVIYMSRVPPFMKPNKARNIFEQYGEVTRLYLAEEASMQRQKRKENGGNGSKQFCEGWIEFSSKKIAKRVAESLNNTAIGSKKGDFYHDDIWNLKYLRKFKWDYLTEKVAYEKRVKENKLKVAMMQAKRANAEIVDQIEKAAVQKHIQERKRKRQEETGGVDVGKAPRALDKAGGRGFRQQKMIGNDYGESVNRAKAQLLNRVFAKADK